MGAAQTLADVAAAYLLNAQAREDARATSERFPPQRPARPADRAAEPAAAAGATRARRAACQAFAHERGDPVRRPRPVQAGQRHPRPPDRRRAAGRRRATGSRASSGPATPWLGSPGTSSCSCARTCAARPTSRSSPDASTRRSPPRSCWPMPSSRSPSRPASAWRSPAPVRTSPTSWWSRPTWPCTRPSARAAPATRSSTYARRSRPTTTAAWRANCASALAHDELDVAYQPIVRSADGLVIGVEALLRWTHPDRGPVPPMSMVRLAEQSGLISEIGCEYAQGFFYARPMPASAIGAQLGARPQGGFCICPHHDSP